MKSRIKLLLRITLGMLSILAMSLGYIKPNQILAANKQPLKNKHIKLIPHNITGTYYYWNVQAQAYEKLVINTKGITFIVTSKNTWLISKHTTKLPNMQITQKKGSYFIQDKQKNDSDKYKITPSKSGIKVTQQYTSNNLQQVTHVYTKNKLNLPKIKKIPSNEQYLIGWHQSVTFDSNLDKVVKFKMSKNYKHFIIGKSDGKAYLEDDFNVKQVKNLTNGNLLLILENPIDKIQGDDQAIKMYKKMTLEVETVICEQQRYFRIKKETYRQFYNKDSFGLPANLKAYYNVLMK